MLDLNLTGKTALVTGGRTGIGRAFVQVLLEQEANVIIIGHDKGIDSVSIPRRKGEKLKFTACPYIYCDLSNSQDRINIIRNINIQHGKSIDILINNAGFQYYQQANLYPQAKVNESFLVMAGAALDLSQQCFSGMRTKNWGRIINVTSLAAFHGTRNTIGYTMAKHALAGMTKCLSNEWAPYGITVNDIAPGYVETDMLDELNYNPQRKKELLGRIPQKRFGMPRDLAGALLFLCSDYSNYMTGQSIIIDGGWRSRG